MIGADKKLMQRAFDLLDPLVREGWALHTVDYNADRTTLFFNSGVSANLKISEYFVSDYKPRVCSTPLASMRRVKKKKDGSDAWRLRDGEGHTVLTVELAQPTDPLPAYVAVSNGASRVRIDANRVPFTVGCVDVNHGDGFDMLRICAADPGDQKPVVMFRLNQYTLNGKELSFNVI